MAIRLSSNAWGNHGALTSKYRNKRTERDGVTFDSKAEADRWSVLSILAKTGHITNLERQVRYLLAVNGIKIGHYVADFRYFDQRSKREVVEDVKSSATKTAVYNLKKKLMKAVHGVDIVEVM